MPSPQTPAEQALAELIVAAVNLEDVDPRGDRSRSAAVQRRPRPRFDRRPGDRARDLASATASSCARTTRRTTASLPRCGRCRPSSRADGRADAGAAARRQCRHGDFGTRRRRRRACARRCASAAADCAATTSRRRRSRPGSGAWPASKAQPFRSASQRLDSRNNRLAWLALGQDGFLDAVAEARARYGRDRIALLVGTSTASIGATEEAYRQLAATASLPASLKASDPPRRALPRPLRPGRAGARRHLHDGRDRLLLERQGLRASRAADPLPGSRMPRSSAASIRSAAASCSASIRSSSSRREPCRPFDVARSGISIGEAGGFALLEREGRGPWLLGYGESSDAHHMSSPHPEGLGARLAIRDALATCRPCSRTTSATSTCTARRARATTRSKRRSSRTSFRHRRMPARPRAGPATRSAPPDFSRPRSASLRSKRPRARHAEHDRARCRLRTAVPAGHGAAVPPVRRSPIPSASAAATACSHSARSDGREHDRDRLFVDGVAFWSPRLPGLGRRIGGPRRHRRCARREPRAGRRPRCCRPPNGGARRIPSRSRSKSQRAPARPLPCDPRSSRASSRPRTATSRSRTTCARRCSKSPLHTSPTRVSQLGPQRGGRLLVHRHRLPCAVHDRQRGGVFVRRGPARGAGAACVAMHKPVLFVAYDAEARGRLRACLEQRPARRRARAVAATQSAQPWRRFTGRWAAKVRRRSPKRRRGMRRSFRQCDGSLPAVVSRRWPDARARSRWRAGPTLSLQLEIQ